MEGSGRSRGSERQGPWCSLNNEPVSRTRPGGCRVQPRPAGGKEKRKPNVGVGDEWRWAGLLKGFGKLGRVEVG